jgi:hypothetical protein
MPRDGALILSEVRVPVLTVVCEPCGLRERYDAERLTRQHGWDAHRGNEHAVAARTASRGPLAGGKANAADPKPLRFFRRIFLGLGPTCL